LLFTSAPEIAARLDQSFLNAGLPAPLPLGRIVTGDRVILETTGGDMDISGKGYDHFALDLGKDAR
jgi:hypothetical protein